MNNNTDKKGRVKKWNEEDLTLWLRSHLGEYIVKRAEIRSAALAESGFKKMQDKSLERKNESLKALSEILPEGVILKSTLVDYVRVIEDAEPEVQRVITAITGMAKDEPET